MDVAQLRTLVCVAEMGSLAKASQKLNVVQPALSRHIKLLEEELGARLFRRHGRGMVTTDIGLEVVEHAKAIFGKIDEIRQCTAAGLAARGGLVTVGLTASISTMIGAALIQRVEREHAGLTLRFVSGFSGTNLQWLQRGEVDVAVTCDPEPTKSLHLTPLVREEFFLVERAVHGKEPRKRVRFPDLVTEQLILQGTKRGIRTTIEECARSAGVSILPKVESDTYHSIMNLVLQGVGTSILPLSGIGELLENEIVWASKIVDPTPSRIVAVAYSAEREVSSATRLVAGIIRDVSTDLVEGGIWNASILAVDDSAAVQE